MVLVEYFFYGTLMDGDVLARVVGQPVPPAPLEAAVVEGYRRLYVAGPRRAGLSTLYHNGMVLVACIS